MYVRGGCWALSNDSAIFPLEICYYCARLQNLNVIQYKRITNDIRTICTLNSVTDDATFVIFLFILIIRKTLTTASITNEREYTRKITNQIVYRTVNEPNILGKRNFVYAF